MEVPVVGKHNEGSAIKALYTTCHQARRHQSHPGNVEATPLPSKHVHGKGCASSLR